MDGHGLRGIAYTDAAGHALPQGERCAIPIKRCLGL